MTSTQAINIKIDRPASTLTITWGECCRIREGERGIEE